MNIEDNTSLEEIYSIDANETEDILIESLHFSVRVRNRLLSNKIRTVSQMLKLSPKQLTEIKGFGKTCIDEVDEYCRTLQVSAPNTSAPNVETRDFSSVVKDNIESVLAGDFSFAEGVPNEELPFIEKYKEAYDIIGEKAAWDCVYNAEKITPIVHALYCFTQRARQLEQFNALLNKIPAERLTKRAHGYINAFTLKNEERSALYSLCKTENDTILSILTNGDLADPSTVMLLKKFLAWCSFDLNSEINALFEKLYVNYRMPIVIKGRAEKQTLEQIGHRLNVTRERVRQIEAKIKRNFQRLHSRIRIISKISAERNGDTVITPAEIEMYCGEHSTELVFLLQSYTGTNYIYDKQLGIFVLGGDSLPEQVQSYIEQLPDIINVNKMEGILTEAEETHDIPSEMLEKAIIDSYRLTGDVYHRVRLSLGSVYKIVVEQYYPNGIRVYNPEELRKFREIIQKDFGDIGLPENDRALSVRIAETCILCGRGRYGAKKESYISKDLANRIKNYIIKSDSPIMLTNTIYHVFEKELVAAGIDNKYYLQGVLHELFDEKFFFHRDYVSKDPNVTSVYSSIVDFIKQARYPITKQQIMQKFPGITDIVVSLSVDDNEVLNYFGEYLHACRLSISNEERKYLRRVIERVVNDRETHSIKEIWDIISVEQPAIMSRNGALIPFSAFSILEYLFREEFEFSRPYIAQQGVEIDRPGDRLHEAIYSSDEFAISDIKDFAKENRYQIYSMLDFLIECNDEYFIASKEKLIRIDKLGVCREMVKLIENVLQSEVDTTIPINTLSCWHRFPTLRVAWNEWLLFSVIKKWGNKFIVDVSSKQLRYAVPIIAPAGMLDLESFKTEKQLDATVKIDDLDNIDELLEDILDDDIWEDEL